MDNFLKKIEPDLLKIKDIMNRNKFLLSTAESCTGGLLAGVITSIAGSSSFYVSSIIAYSNYQKIKLLNIDKNIIENFGAVSKECAVAMAKNIKNLAETEVAISITGIAGPSGGTNEKPVGTVFSSIIINNYLYNYKYNFEGTRNIIRLYTVKKTLKNLLELLNKN